MTRRGRFYRPIALLLLVLSSAVNGAEGGPASMTRIEGRRGSVVVRTAQDQQVIQGRQELRVDATGRMHRPAREMTSRPATRTTLVVTEGAVMIHPGLIVSAGMEAIATGRETTVRTVGRARLRRLERFMERRPRREGILDRDRAEITRITWRALGRLESLDADRLLDGVAVSARFADRPVAWFEDLLRELAPGISRCRATLVLMEPVSAAPGQATARYVVSLELTPRLLPLETVTVSGSGWIEYEFQGDVWRITGGGIRAFHVDSEILPQGFMRLRELVADGAR